MWALPWMAHSGFVSPTSSLEACDRNHDALPTIVSREVRQNVGALFIILTGGHVGPTSGEGLLSNTF